MSTPQAHGAFDIFLSVKGAVRGAINGEAQDAKHKGEIEVLGWSWGMQSRSAAGGGTAVTGRATVRELKVVKRIDSASTGLMSALRTNEAIKEAVLTVRKAGNASLDYFKIKLQDARVASVSIKADKDEPSVEPIERVSFTFNKIEVTYVPQGPDGQARGGMSYIDEFLSAE